MLFFHWAHYYRLKNYKHIIYAWIILSWEIIILLYMWKNHTFIVTLVYCVPYLSNAYCIRITQYIFACVSTAPVSEKSQYILFFYLALSLSLPTERTRSLYPSVGLSRWRNFPCGNFEWLNRAVCGITAHVYIYIYIYIYICIHKHIYRIYTYMI